MTTGDGVANNSIRYIYQDSKGFIWMGTLNGLSRYDGNSFVTYRPEGGNKISLIDHRIRDLEEDKMVSYGLRLLPSCLVVMI